MFSSVHLKNYKMVLPNITKISRTIKIVLTVWGVNVFLDFKNHNIISKVHGILNAFVILIVYSTGFWAEFWWNLTDPKSDDIGITFFLGNSVVGITTTVMRGILMVINRKQLLFLLRWLREVHETGDNDVDRKYRGIYLDVTAKKILKAWK